MSYLTFAVAVVLATSAVQSTNITKVQVDVYYESLCPDSIKFVTTQLTPAMSSLGQFINLTLVPYGKSTRKTVNGSHEFDCHHGPLECYGNKVMSCAIHYFHKTNADLRFINCAMLMTTPEVKNGSAPYPSQHCAENESLDFPKLEMCSNGTEGDNLLDQMGEMTDDYTPKLPNVPTVIFNKHFDQKNQETAMTDFQSVVCSQIGGHKVTSMCKSSASATASVVLVTIVAAFCARIIS